MRDISKVEKIPLREVWKNESADFTTWLQDNLDIINDVLELQLDSADREQAAGSFSVDLVAVDERLGTVIIENQLTKSDHDHLGKVLTYLTSFKAKVGIWVVAEARPEHIEVISFLNNAIEDCHFYMLKIEAVKIENSKPAPLLTKIVGPSEEGRSIGKKKRELASREEKRLQFWSDLLEIAKSKTSLHSNISPGIYSWIGTSSGTRGISLNYSVRTNDGSVEVYIDLGQGSEEENKKIYDHFFSHKEEIEKGFGNKLIWDRMEEKRACRIKYCSELGGWNSDDWTAVINDMVEKMVLLEKSFKPFMKSLAS